VSKRHVVIAGGGFAAWSLARALDRELESSGALEATVVCPGACAPLSPWTHEVLGGRLHAEQAVVPWGDALRRVRVVIGRVTRVDAGAQSVVVDGPGVRTGSEPRAQRYDELVLATGLDPMPRGASGAAELALSLRGPAGAMALRTRLLEALEAACGEESARRRKALLSVAVVGSDERAVSAAVEISRLLRATASFFPRVLPEDPRVLLLSPQQNPCGAWGEMSSRFVRDHLRRAGVELRAGGAVAHVDADRVEWQPSQGAREPLEIRTVVWTMSEGPRAPLSSWPGATWQAGRVRVDELLRIEGTQLVHALGDCAAHPVTASTPAAIRRQAQWLARSMVRRAKGQAVTALAGPPRVDPISLGGGAGIARVGTRTICGTAAGWMARAAIRAVVPGIGRRAALCAWDLIEPLGVRQLVSRAAVRSEARPLYLTPPPPAVGP